MPLGFLFCLFLVFFFFFLLFRAAPRHIEVPRLRVESELQLPAYTTATPDPSHVFNLCHSSQHHWLLNPQSEAKDQTHNLIVPSWVRFCCAIMGTPIPQGLIDMHIFFKIICLFVCFSGPHSRHMEVPRLGL